ncbi:unnamed protein product, partial [Mesorhabditis belari]|uniref:Uncharacterized protein n=1 Tax=Mesorhabditis belari TaxID=2138241 RepID=A0AAF3F525_9BILA
MVASFFGTRPATIPNRVEEDLLPPTDGVSQDGLLSAITSSSGEGVGGRKRTATGNETDNEAKRQRESPGEEQITSSERLHDEAEVLLDEDVSNEALEEIPGEDEDFGDHEDEDLEGLEEEGEIGEMEEGNDDGLPEVIDNFEDDDDDIQGSPRPPTPTSTNAASGQPSDDDIQVLSSDTDEGDGATDSEDDQGIGRMDEEQGDEEEAEDFDYGGGAEDLDDEEAAVDFVDDVIKALAEWTRNNFVDDDGEVEVIQGIDQSDHDAGGDVDEQTQDAENVGDDLGDLGEEREAASAMEEADDEREEGEKYMALGSLIQSAGLYVTPMNRQQTAQRGGMISGRGQPQMARRGGAPGLAQRASSGEEVEESKQRAAGHQKFPKLFALLK